MTRAAVSEDATHLRVGVRVVLAPIHRPRPRSEPACGLWLECSSLPRGDPGASGGSRGVQGSGRAAPPLTSGDGGAGLVGGWRHGTSTACLGATTSAHGLWCHLAEGCPWPPRGGGGTCAPWARAVAARRAPVRGGMRPTTRAGTRRILQGGDEQWDVSTT